MLLFSKKKPFSEEVILIKIQTVSRGRNSQMTEKLKEENRLSAFAHSQRILSHLLRSLCVYLLVSFHKFHVVDDKITETVANDLPK